MATFTWGVFPRAGLLGETVPAARELRTSAGVSEGRVDRSGVVIGRLQLLDIRNILQASEPVVAERVTQAACTWPPA
jgi:hypothetical protein